MSSYTNALNTTLANALTHHDATGFRISRDPQTTPDTPSLYAADVWLGDIHYKVHAKPTAGEAFAAAMVGLKDEVRFRRFTTATRADDLHIAAYVRQFFPEVYDQAAAYADEIRSRNARNKEAAA